MLREVKYLESEDGKELPIPPEAEKIFAAKEAFRKYVANLDLTEKWYNKVSFVGIDNILFVMGMVFLMTKWHIY